MALVTQEVLLFNDTIANNIAFFQQLLRDPDFQAGRLHTGFLKPFGYTPEAPLSEAELAAAVAVLAAAEAPPAAAESSRPVEEPALREAWDEILANAAKVEPAPPTFTPPFPAPECGVQPATFSLKSLSRISSPVR